MASHTRYARRRVTQPDTDARPAEQGAQSRGVVVEEGLVPEVDELPTPAGFGEEGSTASTSSQLLASYEVPRNGLARLREVSIALESNGQGSITVAGTEYGPFSGAVDVTLPLDPSVLTQGYQVRVFHQSTDGATTTTRTTLSVGEI